MKNIVLSLSLVRVNETTFDGALAVLTENMTVLTDLIS